MNSQQSTQTQNTAATKDTNPDTKAQTQGNSFDKKDSWQNTDQRVYTGENDQQGVVGKLEKDFESEKELHLSDQCIVNK